MMKPRARVLALVSVLALVLVACGGDDGGPDPKDTSKEQSGGEDDTTDTTGDDTSDTTEDDTSDTTEDDTSDTTEDDTSDTTEDDTSDTTEDDTSDTTEDDTSDTTEDDTTDTSGGDTSAALDAARAAALTIEDVPDGWTLDSEEESEGDEDVDIEEMAATCPELAAELEEIDDLVSFNREFSGPDGMPSLQSDVAVFADDAFAHRALEIIAGGEFATCMSDAVASGTFSEPGTTYGEPETSPIEVDAGDNDEAGGVEVSVTMTTEDPTSPGTTMTLTMRIGMVGIRSGSLLHAVLMLSIDEMGGFPDAETIVERAVERTAAV